MRSGAFKIAAIYVVAGILWIMLSDKVLLMLQNSLDMSIIFYLSSIKGVAYVIFTGLLLYKLIQLHTSRLAQSEQQYRSYFDYNLTPMWIINRRTLLFTAVNNAAVARYGYTREEFLKMSALDIQQPAEINNFIVAFRELKVGINETKFRRHVKKDGTIINVHITAHVISGKNSDNVVVTAKQIDEDV